MKPIIFNTDMVRAILDERKTQTRRIVKPQPVIEEGNHIGYTGSICVGSTVGYWSEFKDAVNIAGQKCHVWQRNVKGMKSPYKCGDILYVREKFRYYRPFTGNLTQDMVDRVSYYADDVPKYRDMDKWKPSIHMPKKIARLFLKVKSVKVERVQNITDDDAVSEGVWSPAISMERADMPRDAFCELWNATYAAPRPCKKNGEITHYEAYPWSIEDFVRIMGGGTVNLTSYKGLPLKVYENPWVWVIEFERTEKPAG